MTMSIFRSASKPILRKSRNGRAEANEHYNGSQCHFGTQSARLGFVIEGRFGNDSFRAVIHVVESTTAQTIADGTMNLRVVTKERTASDDDNNRLELIVTRDGTRSNCNQR